MEHTSAECRVSGSVVGVSVWVDVEVCLTPLTLVSCTVVSTALTHPVASL